MSLEGYSPSEALGKALRELARFLLTKLYSILSIVHLYSLPDNTLLQWNEVRNGSSAFGVPLACARIQWNHICSHSTLPKAPGCSFLTLGDGFKFFTKDTLKTKRVPDEPVCILDRPARTSEQPCQHRKGWRTLPSQKSERKLLRAGGTESIDSESTVVKGKDAIIPECAAKQFSYTATGYLLHRNTLYKALLQSTIPFTTLVFRKWWMPWR